MLWLIIILLWSIQVTFGGPSDSSPAMRVLYYLIALLGILQLVVTTIEVLEYVTAMLYI
jgi:hypothetical protein